jgi:hypothetical protein
MGSDKTEKKTKTNSSLICQALNRLKENKLAIIISFILFGFIYLRVLEEGHSSDNIIFDDLYATLELPNGSDIKTVKKQFSKLS